MGISFGMRPRYQPYHARCLQDIESSTLEVLVQYRLRPCLMIKISACLARSRSDIFADAARPLEDYILASDLSSEGLESCPLNLFSFEDGISVWSSTRFNDNTLATVEYIVFITIQYILTYLGKRETCHDLEMLVAKRGSSAGNSWSSVLSELFPSAGR